MTNERHQDLILVALAASVVLHVALMFFIRPQVMTHVAPGVVRDRSRGPMTVTAAPEAPEPVKMDLVQDVEAPRESPAAEVEEPLPPVSALETPGSDALSAFPEVAEIAVPPSPEPETAYAPFMSEKIHVEAGVSPVTTPVAPASAPVAAAVTSAPELGPQAVPSQTVDVPLFTAPVFVPEAKERAGVELPPRAETGPSADFVPSAEVFAQVDERIVEAEKAAVRELLDVARATELDSFVSISSDSATEGDWTYFRVKMLPKPELPTVPKDVVVLMDASGSIGNDRLASCRTAARDILRSVANTGDRFNLVAFRDRFSYCFTSWQDCTQESFAVADKWLARLAAFGRTDVFATIRSVLTLPRDPQRPLIAMVVTDGDANTGVSKTAQILSRFTALNDGLVSVYMYGVKKEANRELIDVLTHGNRGESFVFGGSRWNAGRALHVLSERFRDPVLSDLRLVFTSETKAEAYPRLLRNLYRGEAVDLVGRVPKGTLEIAFSVKGLNGAKPYEGFFRLDLSASTFDARLPIAWRKEQEIDAKLR